MIDHTLLQLETDLKSLLAEDSEDFSPIELSRYFVKVRRIKDKFEEISKPFSAFYEELAKIRIPAVFEREGVPSITLDEGYRITVSHRLYASIKGPAKEDAYAWLRANGLADIVTETVNASTLSAVAKTMAEENLELPADYFASAIVSNTSFNKVNKK